MCFELFSILTEYSILPIYFVKKPTIFYINTVKTALVSTSDTREGHDCTQTVRLLIMHEADTDLGVNLHLFLTYVYIIKK
jgi:hypothetical protein